MSAGNDVLFNLAVVLWIIFLIALFVSMFAVPILLLRKRRLRILRDKIFSTGVVVGHKTTLSFYSGHGEDDYSASYDLPVVRFSYAGVDYEMRASVRNKQDGLEYLYPVGATVSVSFLLRKSGTSVCNLMIE